MLFCVIHVLIPVRYAEKKCKKWETEKFFLFRKNKLKISSKAFTYVAVLKLICKDTCEVYCNGPIFFYFFFKLQYKLLTDYLDLQ